MDGTRSHAELIRDHLEQGNRITAIEALNFYQCFRLGARIFDLRTEGLNVQCRMIKLKNGKRIAEYFLLNQNLKNHKLN